MIEYLLDTNIVIHTIRNRPAEIRRHFTRYYGLMAISTVTLMELYYGSENSRDPPGNRSQIEGFVARLDVLPYDGTAAFHTGLIRKELKTIGQPIGAYDGMIAGQARSRGLILVTRNLSDYNRVPGLRVTSWE